MQRTKFPHLEAILSVEHGTALTAANAAELHNSAATSLYSRVVGVLLLSRTVAKPPGVFADEVMDSSSRNFWRTSISCSHAERPDRRFIGHRNK